MQNRQNILIISWLLFLYVEIEAFYGCLCKTGLVQLFILNKTIKDNRTNLENAEPLENLEKLINLQNLENWGTIQKSHPGDRGSGRPWQIWEVQGMTPNNSHISGSKPFPEFIINM